MRFSVYVSVKQSTGAKEACPSAADEFAGILVVNFHLVRVFVQSARGVRWSETMVDGIFQPAEGRLAGLG